MLKLLAVWLALDLRRQALAVLATLGTFAAVIAMANLGSRPTMALLYAGLEGASAGEVVAALDQRLAAVASLGTPEAATLEDQVLLSLIAARPHRLALDTKQVRSREAAYKHWIAAPQSIYERYDLPSLFSTKLGAGFHATPESPAWHDTLSWLEHEL